MKHKKRPPLSKRERNGMIALATVILAIVGTGSFLRTCGNQNPGESGKIVLCDTLPPEYGVKPYTSGERLSRGKQKEGGARTDKDKRKKKVGKKKERIAPGPRRHLDEDLSGDE